MKCKLLKDFLLFYLMAFLSLILIIFFIGFFLYGEEELTPTDIHYPIIWGICYAYQEVFYFVQRYIPLFFPCAFLSVALLSFPLGTLFALIINGLLNKIDLEKK
ncbi:MAG: hypothetical protein ACFNX7_07550 [Capnocytophaga gingivalis]